ncbi:hypothetical protein MSPP1_003357 [Malassezia sp. CBS 17886]|nr:hypothetical protein MSPP1_003357 [Malassezia sp. CBS 17886]
MLPPNGTMGAPDAPRAGLSAPVDPRRCQLFGPVGIGMQLLMGALVLGSLVYKRHRERPRRRWRTWVLDVSKQLVGQLMVHTLNVVSSAVGTQDSGGNPCSLYFLNIALDSTIGVAVIFYSMRCLTLIATEHLLLPGCVSGEYYDTGDVPHRLRPWNCWVRQTTLYLVALLLMKAAVLLLLAVFPSLVSFGNWLLGLFGMQRELQVVFVMALFPLAMNTLQFWLIDSILLHDPSKTRYVLPSPKGDGTFHAGAHFRRPSAGDTAAYVCVRVRSLQASAEFPENTLKSFAQAIVDGSEGIESDVHITQDDVIVMFHDTTLDRTTNGTGPIGARPYYGPDGLEHIRTLKDPPQQIPSFEELCTLLMKPENQHVKLNVDIKPNNDPDRLFRLMRNTLQKFPGYETALAPRLILGLWHPKFLGPAKTHVPSLRRAHIGASAADARAYFWDDCDAFSMLFPALVGAEGQRFLADAKRANKDIYVWTVNREDEMVEATRWGVDAILTDRTADLQALRREMEKDFDAVYRRTVGPFFAWGSLRYYTPVVWLYQQRCVKGAQEQAGSTFQQAVPA